MRLEVWDRLGCDSGQLLAVVPDALNLVWIDSKDGLSSLTGQIPVDSPASPSLGTSRILRITWQDETYTEWVLQDLTPSLTASGALMRAFTAVPIDTLLNQVLLRQVYADGTVATDFELVGLTPAVWIDTIVLTSAAADGLSWLARGVIEATLALDFTFAAESARSFLGRLASGASLLSTTYEFRLRQNGTTGYYIDLIAGIGRGATPLDLRNRRNLVALTRKSSRTGQVTRCSAQGTAIDGIHPTIARARWKANVIDTTHFTASDPLGGDGPIGFDNQFVLPQPRYVRKLGGSPVLIVLTTASGQLVTTFAAHGLSTGDLFEIVADSAGTDLTYLEHPTKVQAPTTGYGLLTAMLDRPDIAGTINEVTDPCFRNFPSSPGVPTNYELVGGMSSANVTRVTTTNRWQSGGQSARLQTAGDGQGLGCLYETMSPVPSAAKPYVSGFIDFYNDAAGSAVRAELVLGKATTAISGTPTRATAAGVTTVTVTTSSAHGKSDGDVMEHTGATPAGYNVTKPIKVVDTTHYTFTLDSDPGAPGGTWVARQVFIFPDQGIEYSSAVKEWDTLGIAGIDANVLGATVMKIRLVQHGGTAADVYLDGVQMTQVSAQEPFLEGNGANRLWQACNRKLAVFGDPLKTYDIQILDLNRLDPLAWPWDSVVLGGSAVVTHPDLGIADTVRIVEIERQLTADKMTDTRVKLATRADEFTDIPAPRTLRQNDAQPGATLISVSALLTPLTTNPNTLRVTLSASPPGALLYYWVGQADQPPPLIGVLSGTTNYSATQWGRYPGPFSVDRLTTMDLKVWAYALIANRTNTPVSWQVAKAASIVSPLALSQPGTGSLTVSWAPSSDVERVRIYARRVASGSGVQYPTSGGEVDETYFVCEMNVTVSGGGIDKTGHTVAGGTSLVIDQTGTLPQFAIAAAGAWANGDHLAVVAVPFGTNGKVGTRSTAAKDYATAAPAALTAFSASKTGNGSDCGSGLGSVWSIAWTPNGAVVNGTHNLKIYFSYDGSAWTLAATVTSPASGSPQSITTDRLVTTGKFDPSISFYFKGELILVSGPTIIDTWTTTPQVFQSQCPV
jgi:hypothetical protein